MLCQSARERLEPVTDDGPWAMTPVLSSYIITPCTLEINYHISNLHAPTYRRQATNIVYGPEMTDFLPFSRGPICLGFEIVILIRWQFCGDMRRKFGFMSFYKYLYIDNVIVVVYRRLSHQVGSCDYIANSHASYTTYGLDFTDGRRPDVNPLLLVV